MHLSSSLWLYVSLHEAKCALSSEEITSDCWAAFPCPFSPGKILLKFRLCQELQHQLKTRIVSVPVFILDIYVCGACLSNLSNSLNHMGNPLESLSNFSVGFSSESSHDWNHIFSTQFCINIFGFNLQSPKQNIFNVYIATCRALCDYYAFIHYIWVCLNVSLVSLCIYYLYVMYVFINTCSCFWLVF